MNYEAFESIGLDDRDPSSSGRVVVPQNAYRPVKRCPNCQSVYLSDTKCEDCGRSLLYHPIGEPFSGKSLYGIKERYHESFQLLVKYYPVFENTESPEAKSFVRNMMKRFDALLDAFGENEAIIANNRRFFYVEILELMDELLRYGISSIILQQKIEARLEKIGSLLTQELLMYLSGTQIENRPGPTWKETFLNHRVMGGRVEYWMKVGLIMATILFVAVNLYSLIS